MKKRKPKYRELELNDSTIKEQYAVSYDANSLSRYKHVDEVLLQDGTMLKSVLGPVDLSVFPRSESFKTYVVQSYEENRIDIIAYKIYGKASMWWAIAYANRLKDPLELREGTVLLIPSLSMLKRFPNPLS